MKRLKNILLIISVFSIVFMTGCSNLTLKGTSKDSVKILLSISEIDEFRETVVNSIVSSAENLNVQVDFFDAEGSVENQVNHIKKAVSENYDAIICLPANIDTVLQLEFTAEDLPIIFLNSCPDDSLLEPNKYIFVGSDENLSGQYQAEYILEQFADKSEINVVLLKGGKNYSSTILRADKVKETLKNSGKTINYVFDDYADWSKSKAKELFELFLTTNQKVDCVIASNDSMALGVAEICQERNIDIPITGIDALSDACDAISEGRMSFTVYQPGSKQGEEALLIAVELARNGELTDNIENISEDGKYVWVPFEKVDKSNVNNYK